MVTNAWTELTNLLSLDQFHILSAAVVLLLRIWESRRSGTLTEPQYRKDMEGVHSCLKIVQVAEKKSLSCGKLWYDFRPSDAAFEG